MKRNVYRFSKQQILYGFIACFFILSAHAFSQGKMNERKQVRAEETSLTTEQKQSVRQILSNYNASSLSSEEAIKINDLFREAGIKGGPALNQAVKEAGFDSEELGRLSPKPDRQKKNNQGQGKRPPKDKKSREGGSKYSIEQAISDRAQLHTIAFDGLAFLTGDICGDSFLPPGKVSDFFGFQYLRDTDQGELGHNTSFVPRAANNVLSVLNDDQVNKLIGLAKTQEKLIQEFAYKRFPLLKAFRQLQSNAIPVGKAGLNLAAVKAHSAELYRIDGVLSYQRAEVLGAIIRSLSGDQVASLDKLKTENSLQWPDKSDQLDKKRYSHETHVAVMTYASELLSWYAGSVEADTYFCPERHGMYFGSFYMKGIPAMGNRNYSISTEITDNKGEDFLNILNSHQHEQITHLVEIQKESLHEIVEVRREISAELRMFMKREVIDRELVLNLSSRYGELDGEISYYYAVHFTNVSNTLSKDQINKLDDLRGLSDYPCSGAFIYSKKVRMPAIENTDHFFE